jgi:DNA-binding XRE family transcriptional regulator
MRSLRADRVSDAALGRAFGISRERVGQILGFIGDHPLPVPVADTATAAKALRAAFLAFRKARGWTQAEAAGRFGVSQGAWSHWERGDDKCSLPVFALMCLWLIDKHGFPE